jgi:superfamily II DNA or RNA helicase
MTQPIKIRICGNAIDVSPDGKSELPITIRHILEPGLRYNYVKLLRGQDAYAFDGTRRPVRTELRLLYTYDRYGRMVVGAGLLPRIQNALEAAGCSVEIEDISPRHPRPERYTEDWDNVVRNFSFKPKQDIALMKIASNQRGIVVAPPGFGKTFMFRAVALLYPKANIAITTRRKDLVEGTRIELCKHLPNIGQIGGGMYRPGRVTVCTADSLHRLNADDVDILIGEEVHELAAPSYSQEITKFRFARMFGFTATPTGRMDNADMKLESLFGPTIFYMSYPEAVKLDLVVPILVHWIDVMMQNNPAAGLVDIPRLRHGIWRNQARNQIIANAVQKFGPDEQVLIMVTTFDHAVHLRQHLPDYTLCYAERNDDDAFARFVKNGMLPADEPVMTPQRRQTLRQQFEAGQLKKVIATDVWSTGVSFNSLAVMVRADARSSEIMDTQIPGRVSRLHDEKYMGIVIDCLDQFDSGFREAARKRRRHYEAKGWKQEMPGYGRRLMPGG